MRLDHWRKHEPILLAFEEAWETSTPAMVDFLPDDIEGREELIVEMAMIDFEHRLASGLASTTEGYFKQFADVFANRAHRDELLSHEFRIRRKHARDPDNTEIESRFPGDSTIADLLTTDETRGEGPGLLPARGDIVGPYRIEAVIGKGAFATVFSATDTALHRSVALKFPSLQTDVQSNLRARILREARVAASLQHANLVPVYGTGNWNGQDYIAMRLVEGQPLSELLVDRSMAPEEAVRIVAAIADALELAHQNGVTHRDVKPANIILEDGVPVLVDFGLAHLGDAGQLLTLEGELLGTPAFMSPEQAEGRGWQADPRSDVYSLGSVLYHMLCHAPPFTGTTTQTLHKVIHDEPKPPRAINSNIDADLQTVILKCLQKEPSDRYASATELRSDLLRWHRNEPIQARPVSKAERLAKWLRRKPMVASLVAVVFALATFGVGVATQLSRVATERDRATEAEADTRRLLAESSRKAGLLALQQGHCREAIEHFQQSQQLGGGSRDELLLKTIEAHFILRDTDRAAEVLRQLQDRQQPLFTMWMAELAQEGFSEFGEPIAHFEQALEGELSESEAEYAKGMLAWTTPEAAEHYRASVNANPFHYRARRMLVLALFSLARLDEVANELKVARQLYPEDTDFPLISALHAAASGTPKAAASFLESTELSMVDRKQWQACCDTLHDAIFVRKLETGEGELDSAVLIELIESFETKLLPLVKERRWHFPPRIAEHFADFTTELKAGLRNSTDARADVVSKVVEIHPERTLQLAEAGLRLVQVSGRQDADIQLDIARLEQARDAFEQSLRTPGFLRPSTAIGWNGLFVTSMTLALVHRHEVQRNTETYLSAAREIKAGEFPYAGNAKLFSIVTLNAGAYDLAERWARRWIALTKGNDAEQMQAYWTFGVAMKSQQRWLETIDACDVILKLDPSHSRADRLRAHAWRQIEGKLGELSR